MTILAAFLGGGVAHATGASSNNPAANAGQIQSQNKRQKMPHSQRKAAAVRLKHSYVQERENRLLTIAHAHRGYTGQGMAGGGK